MASTSPLTEDDWDLIVPRLTEGQCIAFLGAGANVGPKGKGGLPLGGDVAKKLVEALTKVKVSEFKTLTDIEPYTALKKHGELLRLGLHDLPRVAFYVQLRRDGAFLMKNLRTILDDAGCKPSPIVRTLARLPFKLIVTTNWDNLMERALDCVIGREAYVRIVQPMTGFNDLEQVELRNTLDAAPEKLVLYKIHGSFGVEDGGSAADVVVTEDDYIKSLAIAGLHDRGMPTVIASLMKTSTILYLGYSLEDWDFRTIFKSLLEPLERDEQYQSFAFQRYPPRHWVKFWDKRGVSILDMDLSDFAAELEQQCAEFIAPAPDWDACL
jgi:SIR2-like domain